LTECFCSTTHILSAVIGTRPAPEVASWMTQQPADLLFTAAVCQAEILSGIAVLPKGPHRSSPWAEGPRREALEMAALSMDQVFDLQPAGRDASRRAMIRANGLPGSGALLAQSRPVFGPALPLVTKTPMD
jgi:hypothetical protein